MMCTLRVRNKLLRCFLFYDVLYVKYNSCLFIGKNLVNFLEYCKFAFDIGACFLSS